MVMVVQSSNTILFVDDDALATTSLIKSLQRRDDTFSFIYAADIPQALECLDKHKPSVVIVDLSIDEKVGPKSGLDLINTLQERDSTIRILVLTGHSGEKFGIEAINRGAASFLAKPANPDHLLALIHDALKFSQLKRKFLELTHCDAKLSYPGLFFKSDRMKEVAERVGYAASNTLPVLILGETGTGKGIVAQSINSKKNMVVCLPNFASHDLINSELFGHRKGAFTGAVDVRKGLIEEAHGGTLFIDEVAELPPETQLTILRVLQDKKFRPVGGNKEITSDFRLISATNKNILKLIEEGKFRLDLYHRISHIVIEIPPLRDRQEDIPLLAEYFLREISLKEKIQVQNIAASATDALLQHSWPGNVRELRACIESAAYYANFKQRRTIEATDIQNNIHCIDSVYTDAFTGGKFRAQVREYQLKLIRAALEKHDNNQSKAAKYLGMDRTSFRRIMEQDC